MYMYIKYWLTCKKWHYRCSSIHEINKIGWDVWRNHERHLLFPSHLVVVLCTKVIILNKIHDNLNNWSILTIFLFIYLFIYLIDSLLYSRHTTIMSIWVLMISHLSSSLSSLYQVNLCLLVCTFAHCVGRPSAVLRYASTGFSYSYYEYQGH